LLIFIWGIGNGEWGTVAAEPRLRNARYRGLREKVKVKRGKFELGVGVREWMVKTLSPFHAITRGQENDAQVSEIHA
jgi:hypothetical protein